jgi:hypothetical protein
MQLIYFLLLLFTFKTCFSCIWPSSGVPLPTLFHCVAYPTSLIPYECDVEHTLDKFNKLQPSIKFTIEKELHESINFLDLAIHRKDRNLQFTIYRKLTQTDIIIPNSSCHPYEHKLSGINYLLNRLHTYPITEKAKGTIRNTIKNILHNNEYNTDLIRKPPPEQKQNTHTLSTKKQTGLPSHTVAKK